MLPTMYLDSEIVKDVLFFAYYQVPIAEFPILLPVKLILLPVMSYELASLHWPNFLTF